MFRAFEPKGLQALKSEQDRVETMLEKITNDEMVCNILITGIVKEVILLISVIKKITRTLDAECVLRIQKVTAENFLQVRLKF